jgi:hypothetical protein
MNDQEAASENRAEAGEGEHIEEQEPTAGAEQTKETATHYAEIVLFCHPRNVSNLVRSFEDEIQHAAGELPMCVLWSGLSGILHQGVILLEWEGKVSPALLRNLSIDHEIFDFVVSEWTRDENTQRRSDA